MRNETLPPESARGPLEDEQEPSSFCTLGMFIIDDIEYLDGRQSQSLIGGAGTYAALGARIVAGKVNARRVSWVVDMGSDFPLEMVQTINILGTNCKYRHDASRLTTRAWNGYGKNEYRAFRYLTARLRLDENSLSDRELKSETFHMVCSPQRCKDLVEGICSKREAFGNLARPIFVWEPIPDLCSPEQLDELCEAASLVDVLSPNADEFAAIFTSEDARLPQDVRVSKLLGQIGTQSSAAVLIREGAKGSTVYGHDRKVHLSAYHQDGSAVVDPTGAGNTYLGALAMAMSKTQHPQISKSTFFASHGNTDSTSSLMHRFVLPVAYATVAASFAVEQSGLPTLSSEDTWNCQTFSERLERYLERESQSIEAQMLHT